MTHDHAISPPRLLADFTPAEGVIKGDYDDFVVEELPLYEPSGTGTHTYFVLEKRGLSTMNAVADIARALDVPRRQIGYAGLKDARAVTRQWMSVEHVEPDRVSQLELPRMRVLDVTRHTNKLRLGHLRGNAFRIRVRHTEPRRLAELQDALARLAQLGAPNYFGHQR
ncbi:MAG: tRNA pseudouridine(13) synthase TruD, partial [Planctomycetota bacterium]